MSNIKEIIEEVSKIETKQLENKINIEEFKNKKIITYGTYDLLHIGHTKIIDHAIEIAGKQELVIVAVSSDKWNSLKGKKSLQTENIRVENIKKIYPNINVILEDHEKPEETWPEHWDEYDISLIVMGGDHFENLEYINNTVTQNGKRMRIAFYERTPKISSTLLREDIKENI